MVVHITDIRRTRRAMLSAAAAAGAAAVLGAVSRPARVFAAGGSDNQPVVTGLTYLDITETTTLQSSQASPPVLKVTHAAGNTALWATSSSGAAVLAESTSGCAVRGSASGSATGGLFESPSGNALQVHGKASFSRAGRATVAINRSYVDITVSGGLASTAAVVATLQVRRGSCAVTAVRINYPSAGKARIYLSKVASKTATTPVGWFVIG